MAESRPGLMPARRRRVEMNLLPLIDVLVMLIFFAFVTMQFRSVAALNVTLPRIETAGKNALTDAVTISIAQNGEMLFNGKPATEEQMPELIAMQSRVDPEVTVMLKADENTPLRLVTLVMDTCRKHGMNKIRIQSR